jgi:hypothetical protein
MTFLTVTEQKARYGELAHDLGKMLDKFDASHWAALEARKKLINFLEIYLRPSPFHVGMMNIPLLNGERVTFVKVHHEGTTYESMEDEQGVNRYTTRDFGRVTGTNRGDVTRNVDLSRVSLAGYHKPIWWNEYLADSVPAKEEV